MNDFHTSRLRRARAPAFNADALIANLNRLRDNGSLALHMWENDEGALLDPYQFPYFSYQALKHMPARDIDKRIRTCDPETNEQTESLSLLSVSAIPACAPTQPCSIMPYQSSPTKPASAGYLLTLDQTLAHPARVLLSARKDFFSAVEPLCKCRNVYSDMEHLANKRKAPGVMYHRKGEDIARTTQTIIDATRAYGLMQGEIRDRPLSCSEMLVAGAKEHIAAIVLPMHSESQGPVAAQVGRLAAAIVGLQHIEQRVPDANGTPVVQYEVEGDNRGQFVFIGYGKKQLLQVAVDALTNLEAQGGIEKTVRPYMRNGLRKPLKAAPLAYDTQEPVEMRLKKLEALAKQAANMPDIGRGFGI